MSIDKKIFAVIVTYNPEQQILREQYQSLVAQVAGIVYVDNASSNQAWLEELRRNENVHVERNFENKGLGYAHNQGIEIARKLEADFILILDHDSVLRPKFVEQLLSGFENLREKGIRVAAVGPVYINEKTGEKYPITKYCGPFIKRLYPSENPQSASVLISSGSLIPMSIIDQVGGMNEELFIDYIDIEWSYRARKKGYSLYAVPQAVMNHVIGDNRVSVLGRKISVHSPVRRYYLARNSVYMLKCPYVDWGYKLRELTFNLLRIVVFASISSDRMSYLRFSFRGLKDGLRGKFGAIH